MKAMDLPTVLRCLRKSAKVWRVPVVTAVSYRRNPFMVLVSCLLSLRTRDKITDVASKKLFILADSPQKLLKLKPKQLEKAIFPVAFYRNKAQRLYEICRVLVDESEGKIPGSLDQLLKLKGVGRKTANLTLILGHGKLGICVDIHVHRITNRWGYVKTKSPNETEMVLREKLPKRYWMEFNNLLVSFGQNICRPQSPYCNTCRVADYCKQTGVKSYR